MGALDGRVAVITGAGRGIGREHALLFAREGAKVVVNDLGGTGDGVGADATPAQQVVAEIEALGGEAIANGDDVADWEGSQRLINAAIERFGTLDVLVNNAGILRDRMIANMTEAEWDAVIRVHLRGHFLPLKWAAVYWRERSKAGETVQASVINTSSTSGLLSNAGQVNYGAAKTGIATMTEIAQKELSRYGVRVNAICPAARTRLTATVPDAEERNAARAEAAAKTGFDKFDPGNISPFAAYLATAGCPIGGKVFFVYGGEVHLFQPYTMVDKIEVDHRWSIEELTAAADKWGAVEWDQRLGLS
ncbi:MAG: SDR family oxidoreductase [Ilumatobacteraceae bacterium]